MSVLCTLMLYCAVYEITTRTKSLYLFSCTRPSSFSQAHLICDLLIHRYEIHRYRGLAVLGTKYLLSHLTLTPQRKVLVASSKWCEDQVSYGQTAFLESPASEYCNRPGIQTQFWLLTVWSSTIFFPLCPTSGQTDVIVWYSLVLVGNSNCTAEPSFQTNPKGSGKHTPVSFAHWVSQLWSSCKPGLFYWESLIKWVIRFFKYL